MLRALPLIGVLAALVLTVMIGAAQAAGPNTTDTGSPRVCFDTILTIKPDLVMARQLQSQLCQLWILNKRHVFGAQYNDDRSQISMVVTYPYAASLASSGTGGSSAGRPPVYLFETYNAASGSRLSSVELKQALLPPVSSDAPVAFCVTANDILLSVYGNGSSTSVQHFDRTGVKKPLVAYAPIAASDRIWMSCTDSSVYMSVPAANAVWRLSPTDGLLERIVARVQSPSALSLDYGMLRVASGRPARQIHTYDLYAGEAHRGQVDVSAESLHLRGISIVSPSPFLMAVVDDEGVLRQLTDPLVNTVTSNSRLAVRYAEAMMADGRTAIVNGLPVFIKTATPITAVSNSELLNAGNADRVGTVLYTRDSRQLITIDRLGAVSMYSAFDHQCPIVFVKPLPPLITTEASLIYTDERDWRTPLLYVAMADTTLVLRPSAVDSDETVWPSFCPDAGETILTGLSTSWPVRVTCALCGAELVCLFDDQERRVYPLPLGMIGSLNAVRLAWDGGHQNVLAFHLGTDIWTLPIDSGSQRDEATWTLLRQFSRLPVVFDITYWDVREVYADVYSLRLSADYILLVTGASGNWTAEAGAPLDRNQALGNKLLLVPNVRTSYYDEQSICVGFPLNVTREDLGMTAKQRAAAARDMRIAMGGLIACSLLCTLLCCMSALYRVTIVRMPWSKHSQTNKPFSRLGSVEALQTPPSLWSRLKAKLSFGKSGRNESLLDEFERMESLNGNAAREMANRNDPDVSNGHYEDVPIVSPAAPPSAAAASSSPPPPNSDTVYVQPSAAAAVPPLNLAPTCAI